MKTGKQYILTKTIDEQLVWLGVYVCVCPCGMVRLTWALFDTEGSIGVLCPGVVFQLEGGGVVDKWLGALGHTRTTVIEVGAGLQTYKYTHTSCTYMAHAGAKQVFKLVILLKGS